MSFSYMTASRILQLVALWLYGTRSYNVIIKVHYNFISSFVYNFLVLQYLTKIFVLKTVGSVKIIKATVGLELMTCRFVVNAQTYCDSLLD